MVCTEGAQKAAFDKGGGAINIARKTLGGRRVFGSQPFARRKRELAVTTVPDRR